MMMNLITYISILLILVGCSDSNLDRHIAGLSSLHGKDFVLEVDRVAESPSVQFPADELNESDYVVFTDEKIYHISFSEDGQVVTIEPDTMRGEKIIAEANFVGYELTDGVFAGGRFTVRLKDDKFEAELTLYGSGIPILWSERGDLLPK